MIAFENTEVHCTTCHLVKLLQKWCHDAVEFVSVERKHPEIAELVSDFVSKSLPAQPTHSDKFEKHPVHGRPRNSGSMSHIRQCQPRRVTKTLYNQRQSVES